MMFNAAADRVTVGERMEHLVQTVTAVGSGDKLCQHIARGRMREPR
jgi:hypothetical protein